MKLGRSVVICTQLKLGLTKSAVSFCHKDYSHFCTPHTASIVCTQNQNLSLARAVFPELCLAWLFSVVKYLSISWCQLLNPIGLWSLLNEIQSCHLLLNPRIIITRFMGFLSTAYFGLLVLKHFHYTSSAPGFANLWCG